MNNMLKAALSAQRVRVVNLLLVDICGDIISALLLGQILYWSTPDAAGVSRLRVFKDGYYWLAKARTDWWEEIRITPDQYDRAINVLRELKAVEVRNYHFNRLKTPHIRVVWEELERLVAEKVELFQVYPDEPVREVEKPVATALPLQGVEKDLCKECGEFKPLDFDQKRRCKYCFVLDAWAYYLPSKPQPKRDETGGKSRDTIRRRIDERWKEQDFRDGFHAAMERASLSGHLKKSWFDLPFFLSISSKTGEKNWIQILNGYYDSFDEENYPQNYAMLMEYDKTGRVARTAVSPMGG